VGVEANTAAIVRLAWARMLGLPDEALADGNGARIVRPGGRTLTFVRIFGQGALCGPDAAIEALAEYPDEELTSTRILLDACPGRGARAVGAATLAYLDSYVTGPLVEDLTLSADSTAAAQLERRCPPDDVAEVGLSELEHRFVLAAEDGRPLAGAGFEIWQGLLAQLGVLTAPDERGKGRGREIAAFTGNEALDLGLVPQWRARSGNQRSRDLALSLGYEEVGSQSTVLLPE